MSEHCKEEDNLQQPCNSSSKESAASEDLGDQFSTVYGDWGKRQTLIFFMVGLLVILCTYPTLIMTFMNAKIDFWCQRPENVIDLNVEDWMALSGGDEGNCQIANISYADMTLEEAKRYKQVYPSKIWGDRRVYIGLIYIIHTRIAYIRTSIRQIKAKQTKVRHRERE